MTHATVRLDGRDIPLIGIPKEAGEEECDVCHQRFKLQDVTFALGKFWCQGCLEVIRAKLENPEHEQTARQPQPIAETP